MGTVEKRVMNTSGVPHCAKDKRFTEASLALSTPAHREGTELQAPIPRKPLTPRGWSCLRAAAQLSSLASSQGLQVFCSPLLLENWIALPAAF